MPRNALQRLTDNAKEEFEIESIVDPCMRGLIHLHPTQKVIDLWRGGENPDDLSLLSNDGKLDYPGSVLSF